MKRGRKIGEALAGFRLNRGCTDHIYTLDKTIQGRKDAGLTTYQYCTFLDVQEAYDIPGSMKEHGL